MEDEIQLKRRAIAARAIVWVVYSAAGYVAVNFAVGLLVLAANNSGISWDPTDAIGSLVARILIYGLTIGLMLWGLRLVRLRGRDLLKIAGVNKPLSWKGLGLAIGGFFAYMILTIVASTVASHILPGYNLTESQNVGVSNFTSADPILLYLGFVIIAPVAEEIIFRGLLYGYMRRLGVNKWLLAVIVSALFGLAHGQWNVGIDVFCLSLVLCVLREFTGNIWSGVALHMIKNGLALTLLLFVL